MPNRFSSRRMASLRPSTANLLAWYQAPRGVASRPPIELMLTMVPLPWARMAGSTIRVRCASPKRFTSSCARASDIGTSSTAPYEP